MSKERKRKVLRYKQFEKLEYSLSLQQKQKHKRKREVEKNNTSDKHRRLSVRTLKSQND